MHAHRESGVKGVSYAGPCDVWSPTVAHKIVHQNASLKKFKKFYPRGARQNVSPGLAVALDRPAC